MALTAAGDTGVHKTGEKATLHTVSGHRDGYAALPEIRTQAAASRHTAH